MSDIPEDLIVEILRKLPSKSLSRFKSVCKRWNSITLDPQFQAIQRKTIIKPYDVLTSPGHVPIIMCPTSAVCVVYDFRDDSFDFENMPDELSPQFSDLRGVDSFVTGPLSGVVLLYNHHGDIALFNHAARDYMILSQHSPDKRRRYIPETDRLVFGEVMLENGKVDFVVLKLYSNAYHSGRLPELFRQSTGQWKILEPNLPVKHLCPGLFYIHSGMCMNEVLYWLAYDKIDQLFIVCFDLKSETFSMIDDVPREIARVFLENKMLSCYTLKDENFLSITVYVHDSMKHEVWVMKECGAGRSRWVKEESIKYGKERKAGDIDSKREFRFNGLLYQESLVSFRP